MKNNVKNKNTNSKANNRNNSWQKDIQTGLKTLGLASIGTVALVTAHHLGRKQYNADARLSDYIEGVLDKLGCTSKSEHTAVKLNKYTGGRSLSRNTGSTGITDVDTDSRIACHDNAPIDTQVEWVSGVAELQTNEFAVVGINKQRDIVWQTSLSERVHDIVIQPKPLANHAQHVAVMGRRPSTSFWILQAVDGKLLQHIQAQRNRHFYGHACYSLDGKLLYVTENNTEDFSGVIGVYEVRLGYEKVAEFATQGIGPHELVMHPDGDTLVIANGGIKTEKASREELNIDSMQPSLVYLNRHSGELLQQVYPEHNQMSVRHLAMHQDGRVIIGIQFQGERHLSVPLVLTHQLGQVSFTSLKIPSSDNKGWHRFHHYIASVAVDSAANIVCATSPIGGCAAVFDLSTGLMMDDISLPDCAGVALWSDNLAAIAEIQSPKFIAGIQSPKLQLFKSQSSKSQFLVSDGQGHLTGIVLELSSQQQDKTEAAVINFDQVSQPYAFDNHLSRLTSSY